MPRKPKPAPKPIEIFNTPEFEIEVWDCLVDGRGKPAALNHERLISELVELVCTDYLDVNSNWRAPHSGDYLKSGSEFAREMERRGYGHQDGCEPASLRKTVYPKIMVMIETCLKIAKK